MIEIGRVCVKIAGRDAGKKCVVVDILDRTFVLIDGETRRKRCNILHLEPMDRLVDIQKGASHESVSSILKKEGIEARSTTPSGAGPKPVKKRKSSQEIREGKEKKAVKPQAAPKKKEQAPAEAKVVADAQSAQEHKAPKKAPSKKKKAE